MYCFSPVLHMVVKLTQPPAVWKDPGVTYVQGCFRWTGNFKKTSINTRSFSNHVFSELSPGVFKNNFNFPAYNRKPQPILTVPSNELLFLRWQTVDFSLIQGLEGKRCGCKLHSQISHTLVWYFKFGKKVLEKNWKQFTSGVLRKILYIYISWFIDWKSLNVNPCKLTNTENRKYFKLRAFTIFLVLQ